MRHSVLAAFLLAASAPLMAVEAAGQSPPPVQPAPQGWGVASLASYHFGDRDGFLAPGEHFNQLNYGLGAELRWQPRHAVAAGYYRNSVDGDSFYALYQYTPLQLGPYVRLGGMAGVVTGYPGYNDGGPAPAGGLLARVDGRRAGVNLIYLPRISGVTPNTLGLQVTLRLGD